MKSMNNADAVKAWAHVPPKDWYDWEWQYKNRIQTISQLARALGIRRADLKEYETVVKPYPLCITPFYFSLMNAADENDPIALQCFPDRREIEYSLGGMDDPLEEVRDMPVPGLIHRYPDRCVVIITNTCASYCRHCNRKWMWKKKLPRDKTAYLRRMIEYVSATPVIREVILSGGDPLTVDEGTLEWFLGSLRAISHMEVLRIGSRIPVVMPMRITTQLCFMLRKYRPLWFNTQFNHPREISPEASRACEMLLEAGIPVSNQSVFLRGVNDRYETLRDLYYGLQKISVRPYYLFQCDPVKGADHFRTDMQSGLRIMEKLWRNVSGLCLPQYVFDVPGGKGKYPLSPFSDFLAKGIETQDYFFDKKGEVN
jgi:lysine 2,3-aminomutase